MIRKKTTKRRSSSSGRSTSRTSRSVSIKKVSHDWRTKALFLIFFMFSATLLWRLYNLQIINGDYYMALALGQNNNSQEIALPRGEIYSLDKAGLSRYLFTTNKEMQQVYAVPSEIEDPETVFERILEIIDIPLEEEEKILVRLKNKNSSYALLADQLSEEQARRIDNLELEGIYLRDELVRFYPAGSLASHILGFVGFRGDDRVGQYGIEGFYEDTLTGFAKTPTRDGSLGISSILSQEKLLNSSAQIELTIDYGIQFMLEQKLKEAVEWLDAPSASAILMDPKTGAIIAMASVPSYNPNSYSEVEDIGIFINQNIQSVFEPGSIFKPITMAAAIDGGAVTPQSLYTDKGILKIDGYSIYNSDNDSHGVQTMTEVLEKSLNTGAIFAQQELGKNKFRDYLEDFQLHESTGVDLPGETSGNIRNIQNTNRDINFATAAFGQGIAMTPLRLLSSLSAIANKGVIMRPYIVQKIIRDGVESVTEPQETGNPISTTSASRVASMMVSVVDNGFGAKAAVPGYKVAGKTGTAQIPNKDGPGYSDETIHSFIGFAPAYNPRFIGIIKVDNPQGIRFSADSVAPIFGEIASFVLQYYKIPPQ